MKTIKNKSKSIRARLLNLKKVSGHDYMYLLARYFNERLLYRVSVSVYRRNFLLKGGSLLYALEGLNARPTVDVDFMADMRQADKASVIASRLIYYCLVSLSARMLVNWLTFCY